jgi:hypothetical protein
VIERRRCRRREIGAIGEYGRNYLEKDLVRADCARRFIRLDMQIALGGTRHVS